MKKDDISFSFKGEMVSIPAGEFMMGDDIPIGAGPLPKETERALPIHRVTLDAFDIGATQVTNARYCNFLNAALNEKKIVVKKSNAGNGWIMTRVKESVPCWEVEGAEGEKYAGWRYIMLSPIQGLGRSMAPEHVINRCWITYNPDYHYFYVHMCFENNPVSFVPWYGAHAFSEFYGLSL
ncbi:MAG: SUMF1/EgtB/PvdO family nonheme iron enzyme, partial [Deltaproteobacteria bacterium]|nr:SUMF1/EgtB/PvdO family nonheme iron enzyme [Deltaproteobacteria bacterium]